MLRLVQGRSPFAHVLSAEMVGKLARRAALERGRFYATEGRVKAIAKIESQLVATVLGTAFYAVSIWVKGDALGYICSCPAGTEGAFCKHCVAVAFAWLDKNP
jgi:uncharacterized Zn finger protein